MHKCQCGEELQKCKDGLPWSYACPNFLTFKKGTHHDAILRGNIEDVIVNICISEDEDD